MFAIGCAHDCAACITADEVHDGRHREIATLVKEWQALVVTSDTEKTPSRKKATWSRGPLQNINNVGDYERLAPRPQRNDMETSSSTSVGSENHYDTPSKAEQRAYKKTIKHEKSLKKSAKNSERHVFSLRQSEIDQVTKVLHGNLTDISTGTGHPLATDQALENVIERNRRLVANIQDHKVYLRSTIGFARCATNSQRKSRKRGKMPDADASLNEEEPEEVVNAILLEPGIDLSPTRNKPPDRHNSFCSTRTAPIAAVVQKLRTAIHEDLDKHENEQRQTYIGAGGFWRYVGRPVFDRMTEVARSIDWRTGQIIKERFDRGEQEDEIENEMQE